MAVKGFLAPQEEATPASRPESAMANASAGDAAALVNRIDLVPELIVADRADDDILADDEGRRAIDLQRVSELHALVESGLDVGALHVLGEPVHVEPELLGDRERLSLADRPARRKQLRMERPELVARQLVAGRACHLGRLDRPWPQ